MTLQALSLAQKYTYEQGGQSPHLHKAELYYKGQENQKVTGTLI